MPFIGGAMIGGSVITGLMGASATRDAAQTAADAQARAMGAVLARLDAVGMPPDQSARIILQQYQQQGILTPELEQQVHDLVSQFQQVKADQQARNMYVQGLQQMSQYGKAGLTPEERAVQMQQRQQVQQDLNANQQAIIQNMQARGQGGSGAELAARLGASQGAANQASMYDAQLSGLASQRAMQAIAQGTNMAGNLEQMDFGEQAAKASAMDQFSTQNQMNRLGINQRNVAAANVAKAANLANKQMAADRNVSEYNQETRDRLNREVQNYQLKLQQASGAMAPLSQLGNAQAQAANQIGQANANMWAGIGGALNTGLSTYGQQQNFNTLMGMRGQNTGAGPTVANANMINYSSPTYAQDLYNKPL